MVRIYRFWSKCTSLCDFNVLRTDSSSYSISVYKNGPDVVVVPNVATDGLHGVGVRTGILDA